MRLNNGTIILGTVTAAVFFLFSHAIVFFMDPEHVVAEVLFCILISLVGFGLGFSAGRRR
jgi:hypothetical protein